MRNVLKTAVEFDTWYFRLSFYFFLNKKKSIGCLRETLEKRCFDAFEDSFFPARLSTFTAEVWQQEGWGAAECLCSPWGFFLAIASGYKWPPTPGK